MFGRYKNSINAIIMKEPQKPIAEREFDSSAQDNTTCNNLQFVNNNETKGEFKIIRTLNNRAVNHKAEKILGDGRKTQIPKKTSIFLPQYIDTEIPQATYQNFKDLFRLFVKNGEYVYARANDIVMIESCDHLVKVYLGINSMAKLTVRHNTLKDFLSQLPGAQFIRINRFCAVNILRLSGGNCNEQTFEFDFKISIKLTHSVSHMAFSALGK